MSKASATIISTVHNYLDGDVKIVVEQVSFQLHMNILSLASEVFKSMFTLGSSRSKKIPEIPLENETIESFQNLLSFIYPTRNLRISWENVDDMLRLADRYEVLSLHDRASEFLEYNFKIDPIRALLMADEYSLRKTYKESSKLVLEVFPKYKLSSHYKILSPSTSSLLMHCYGNYLIFLTTLDKMDFITNFTHTCHNKDAHNNVISALIKDRIDIVCRFPTLTPSKFFSVFCQKFEDYKDTFRNQTRTCSYHQHFLTVFDANFGNSNSGKRSEERVILNVGAHPETLLGTMFKDSNKGLLRPQNGNEYFFDRNSKAFHYILEYYRTAILVTRQEIIEEMKYFQIPFVSHQKMLDVIDYANCLDEFIIALEDSIIEFCKNYGKVLFITFRCWDVLRNNRNVELYNTVPRNEDLKKYLKPFQYSGYRILEIFNEEISARIENRFPGIKCVTVKHDEILDEDDISIYILKISVTHKTDSSRIGGGNGDGSDDDVVDKQNILENSNILKRKADWNVG
nr:12263_t:CDS:2 [Entrophospora candida]